MATFELTEEQPNFDPATEWNHYFEVNPISIFSLERCLLHQALLKHDGQCIGIQLTLLPTTTKESNGSWGCEENSLKLCQRRLRLANGMNFGTGRVVRAGPGCQGGGGVAVPGGILERCERDALGHGLVLDSGGWLDFMRLFQPKWFY